MECPACPNKLDPIIIETIKVDVCTKGCGGQWYDNFELEKVDEPNESAGAALLKYKCHPGIKLDLNKRYHCPKCPDIIMMRHFFSIKHKVSIDECANCGGIWLEAGELSEIRDMYPSDAARQAAAKAYFAEMFDPILNQELAKNKEKLEKYRKFAKMFKFLCPSYWIPGKQDWGAF